MSVVRGQPFVKRISMPIELRRDITLYGKSNLYPQMVEQILFRSPITNSAVNSLSEFTAGEGFMANGDVVINRFEMTLDDLLKATTDQYSIYDGWAWHLNINELFMITEINLVDFKNVRYGLPDNKGRHIDVVLNKNWEQDFNKMLKKTEQLERFPLWNRREDIDIEKWLGKNPDQTDAFEEMPGFIFYFTPTPEQYPRATLDPILDSSQTNAEVQTFELSNIQNGFLSTSIFIHRGKIESKEERMNLEEDLRQIQGPENANSVMIAEVPVDFEGSLIEPIAANNNDRLFELTDSNVIARILANYSQPYPISGIQPPNGGIFNREEIANSTLYYNAKTRNRRMTIARAFNKVLEFWADGSIDIEGIKEIQFAQQAQTAAGQAEGDQVQQEEEQIEQPQAKLNKVYGRNITY